jgi:hypothetical protein
MRLSAAEGLAKQEVQGHALGGVVKHLLEEGCGCDPSIQWTAVRASQTTGLVALWSAARCGDAGDDEVLLPLSKVSAVLAEDDYCAFFCSERAGTDPEGKPLVSKKVLELMALYYGDGVETALASLRDVTGQEWFISSAAAFEQHCAIEAAQREGGYGVDRSLFGIHFAEQSPHYSLLRWNANKGLSKPVLLAGQELVAAVMAVMEEGDVCIPEIRWTSKLLQKQLLEEEALQQQQQQQEEASLLSVPQNGNMPLWTLLSGHSYAFMREVNTAFPDATTADWTGLLQWD